MCAATLLMYFSLHMLWVSFVDCGQLGFQVLKAWGCVSISDMFGISLHFCSVSFVDRRQWDYWCMTIRN